MSIFKVLKNNTHNKEAHVQVTLLRGECAFFLIFLIPPFHEIAKRLWIKTCNKIIPYVS